MARKKKAKAGAKRKRKSFLDQMKKYLGKRGWKALLPEARKSLRDLAKLQDSVAKHFPRAAQREEYVNWNAEIEYDRMDGGRSQ